MAKRSEKTLPCDMSVHGCKGKIGPGSITGLCDSCQSNMRNWLNQKTAAERIKRARHLKVLEARLSYLLPEDKVEILSARVKYKPLPVLPGRVKAYRKRTKYKVMKS